MNIKDRKNVLSSSNQRLVVMGLFNTTGCDSSASQGVTFSGRPASGQPKLAVPDLFERIAPELRYVKDKSTRIGDTAFNTYKLQTPAEGGGVGYGQPITEDSPLLKQDGKQDHRTRELVWQAAGGELFQTLLKDLDEVVRFSDGRFSGALLKLARRYMVDYSDTQLADDKVDRADWEKLAFNHAASSAILSFVTCYRTDENNAAIEIKKALNAFAAGPDAVLNGSRVDQLVAGLEQFKRIAEAGQNDDALLQEISKAGQYGYLADFPSSTYGITVAGVGANDFLAYYRYYLQKSNAVHRFLRNASLHSYLFMWLAGKYGTYASAEEFPAVAKEMYALGVEGQGDKRIPGETKEERRRNFELVRSAESEVARQDRAKLGESTLYEKMQSVLEDGILEKLRPEKTFRREALNKRNREMFVFLGQMAGGQAGKILGQATDRAGALARVYRAAKNVRAKEGEVLQADAFGAAFRKLRTGEMTKLVDVLLEEVGALKVEGEELQEAVCVSVVKRIAVETKTYFDQNWLGSLDAIEEEVQQLGDIYDLRTKLDVERRESSSLGMPMTVLTDKEISILAPTEATAEDTKRYADSLQKAATAAGIATGQATASLSVPAKLETEVSAAKTGSIKNAEGKAIARLEGDADRGVIKATLAESADAEDLLGEHAIVDFGELKDVEVVSLEGLDLQPLVAAKQEKEKHLDGVASNFGSYSDTQSMLRKKYEDDRGGKGDTAFTRAARALALGEFMAATPPEESNLGVADLSNMLGMALDMVEHVGEVSDAKLFASGDTLPADVLGRMNLSVHYPVNNPDELSRVLQYHHGQCETLGNLTSYFSELNSLKNLFENLEGTAAEITVYNCKLADHADPEIVDFESDLFVINQHPVAAYLTQQAIVTASSLSALAKRVTRTLAERGAEAEETARLQVPLIVTPVELDVSGIGLPVVNPSVFPVPNLVSADSDAAKGKDVVPSTKAGLDSYLALAASLAVDASGPELGQLPRLRTAQKTQITETLLVQPRQDQNVLELFREAWFVVDSPICARLCMTKWLNICLLEDPQDADHLTGLLDTNCLTALKKALDPKQKEDFLGGDAFAGLESKSWDPQVYMPHLFEGREPSPIAAQTGARALTAGAWGIRDRTTKKESNFGEMTFLTTFSQLIGAGTGDDATEAE